MPPTKLDAFPEREPKTTVYAPLFDGGVWKVDPDEYEYGRGEIKAFISSLKSAASKLGFYIRTFQTADDHVIVQRRPADYVPPRGGRRPKKS